MDEGTLNDLLECSVCLERLDTSSKVLPCQHTFCKKCLDEIVEKHKELRCPECRVLVQVKVEDLPPNVLLMRILEGMKNAGNPILKKVHRSVRSPNQIQVNPMVYSTSVHHQHSTPDHRTTPNKHQNLQITAHQPYAIAAYDYTSREAGDLSFKRGDIIILRKRIDNNWYQGECGGKQGVFPVSYVQIITPVPSHLPQCKALYDFRMSGGDEEEGCLSFRKNDIINVIRRVDENWAEGKLDGRIGIFPLAFVELNDLARSLMKLSTNVQPGPSRLAPPTPTNEDTSPLIPTDHTRTVINQRRASPQINVNIHNKQPSIRSDSSSGGGGGSSSSTTPNASSSNASSSSSTAPSSPATPPPRSQQQPPPQQLPPKNIAPKPDILLNSNKPCATTQKSHSSHGNHSPDAHVFHTNSDKEKRHSFSSVNTSHQTTPNHNRHSAEILALESQVCGSNVQVPERSRRNGNGSSHDIQLPATYVALYAYKPQKADELELKKGNIYMVTERCQDGWFKGTSNRTQKCGVFPGNYVVPARGAHTPSPSGGSATCPARPAKGSSNQTAPELPPRAVSPSPTPASISSSWHGQENNRQEIGRSCSQAVVGNTSGLTTGKDKSKERKEKGTVSLMRRLTSMKRCKSPPPSSYSMDNPVFEDAQAAAKSSPAHPIHVRSGSCPSQLLQLQPNEHRLFGSTSQRHKHKERPSVLTHTAAIRPTGEVSSPGNVAGSSGSSPDVHRHKKSNSLPDSAAAAGKMKTGVQTVRERFRCIAPYPPNSEYELELQVNDIIYVHKKRDDGWYKGTQQRTGKTGLFPASFVENY